MAPPIFAAMVSSTMVYTGDSPAALNTSIVKGTVTISATSFVTRAASKNVNITISRLSFREFPADLSSLCVKNENTLLDSSPVSMSIKLMSRAIISVSMYEM